MALTDYEKYIRTEELLALQKTPDQLTCHDELLFQTIHQVAELWMKCVAFELRAAAVHLDADRTPQAARLFERVRRIQILLKDQFDVLDTLAPKDYMTIRTGLGSGSGQESPGFKTLLKLPGEIVWPAFQRFLDRSGVTLRAIYEAHEEHAELFRLCEGLVDFDQLLQTWRSRHLMLVYRIIGSGTPSLKGKPSELLAHGMKQRFFPKLWEVREEVFAAWTKNMLADGKDTGYHG